MTVLPLLRRQFRSPGFALTALVLVAAAVLVNASAFNALHALRWKALPYADGDALVDLRANLRSFGFDVGLTEHLRGELAADRTHFTSVLGFASARATDEDGRPWRLARVTPAFSRTLGVPAALGRSLAEEDARPGADAVLVLGDAVWRSRFGADPDVVGRRIRFGDRAYTVVGVMPRGFVFPDATTEAWRPYVMSEAERRQSDQGNVGDLDVVARLAPGVSPAQAGAALAALLARDASVAGLRTNAGLVGEVRAWRDRYARSHWRALALFQLAALILLAVVAANLVNLQLDRLLARRRELDVRRAIGASERAIAREIVADLAPPVLAGLALGLALTPFATGLLERRGLLPDGLPQGAGFGPAAVAMGLAVAALALASGALAALVARPRSRLSAREGAAGLGRLRPLLLVAQVMLTTALLGCGVLLLRSAANLVETDRGFDARGVLVTLVDPIGIATGSRSFDPATDTDKYAPVVEAVRQDVAGLPGVDRVAVATAPPFSRWETVSSYHVPGRDENIQARGRGVGPGYFAALGIGLVAGREFTAADAGEAGPVIVDEVYRDRYLQGADPLAAYVDVATDAAGHLRRARIVGVARTVKHESLDEAERLPTIYQYHDAPLPMFWLVTHTSGDVAALAETVRRRVLARVPGADVGVSKPLADLVEATLTARRALLEAIGGFAAGTLLLAALGLAAVLGFAVRRRTAELGVRMALGATPAGVRNLVLRQGGLLAAGGIALGLAVGVALARLLADRLFGVGFADAASWAATVAVVAAVALLACWWPAHRAAATDPVAALRAE